MNLVRTLRRSKEISQYELERRTRIAQSSLSLIERGYKEPTLKMKRRISKALGCELIDVFPEIEKIKGGKQ